MKNKTKIFEYPNEAKNENGLRRGGRGGVAGGGYRRVGGVKAREAPELCEVGRARECEG